MVLLVFIVEEVYIFAIPEAVATFGDLFKVRGSFLIVLQIHICHSPEGICSPLGRTAVVYREGVVRKIDTAYAVRQVSYNGLPDFFRRRLPLCTLVLGDDFEIKRNTSRFISCGTAARHSSIDFVQTGINPGTEKFSLAHIPLILFLRQTGTMEIGNGIICRVYGGVRPFPLIPYRKLGSCLGGIGKSPQVIVVRNEVTTELHSHPTLAVDAIKIIISQLDTGKVRFVEIHIKPGHTLVSKTFICPHISACYLIGRIHIQHIPAGKQTNERQNDCYIFFHDPSSLIRM